MFSNNPLSAVFNILRNTKKMLAIAWKMDSRITFGYYFTAASGAIIPVLGALVFKYFLDNFLEIQNGLSTAIPLVLVALLAARYFLGFCESVVKWTLNRNYFDYLFRYKIQNELNKLFYGKTTKLDIAHLEDPNIQNLITKVRDTITWRPPDFMRNASYFFEAFVGYVSAFIVLIPFGVWLPITLTLMTLPRLYLRIKYGTIQWSIYGSGVPEVRKIWYFTWILAEQKVLREAKIFQSQKYLLKKLEDIQHYLFSLHKKPLDNYVKLFIATPLFEIMIVFGVAYFFLPDVLSGAMTIGSFTFLASMIDQLVHTSGAVVGTFGEMHEHNLYVEDFFAILALERIIKEDPDPITFSTLKPPKIELKNVSFAYPNGRVVLKDVSFVVNPGERVALVGVNGAGKTTIIKLICRFYDVDTGEILINGTNIKKIKLSNLYDFLGTLFQDFVEYHFTVKENITLGKNESDDDTLIVEAAKKAGADSFIEKLPNKYDQVLGKEFEGGEELSGGQWQKLAIARAFYQQPPVLIMDEPTSAIDAEAEYEIFNNLEKEYKNKTLILVSHRFSTVRNADKILVLEEGRITEEGSHEELMKKNGKYAKMFRVQAKGYS